MLAKIGCLLTVLLLAGCGSKSNGGRDDAGISHDAVATADSVATSDVPATNDSLPDRAGPPDRVADGESPRGDLLPVEAARESPALRDLAADDVTQDRPGESGLRDLPILDSVMPSDKAARDHASESPVADAAGTDVATDIPREAAREVLPFTVDGRQASFCSGEAARMVLNGIESSPVVSATYYLLSCCSAGAIVVTTATFPDSIAVGWQDWAARLTGEPVTFDLANLPAGFGVRVVAGCDPRDMMCTLPCDPRDTGCKSLGDGYDSGYTGALAISPPISAWDMSVCLHVEETNGSPHSIIHSLDLYAPHVYMPRAVQQNIVDPPAASQE
jgi:hypothetical protein